MKSFNLNVKVFLICSTSLIASVACSLVKYEAMNGREYLIELEYKYNWFKAWHTCARYDSQLLIIDSYEKNRIIMDLLQKVIGESANLWLGANDEFSGEYDRPFYWSATGEEVQYSHWAPNNPSYFRTQQHCVHVWALSEKYEWNDFDCKLEMGFICEKHYFLEKIEDKEAIECTTVQTIEKVEKEKKKPKPIIPDEPQGAVSVEEEQLENILDEPQIAGHTEQQQQQQLENIPEVPQSAEHIEQQQELENIPEVPQSAEHIEQQQQLVNTPDSQDNSQNITTDDHNDNDIKTDDHDDNDIKTDDHDNDNKTDDHDDNDIKTDDHDNDNKTDDHDDNDNKTDDHDDNDIKTDDHDNDNKTDDHDNNDIKTDDHDKDIKTDDHDDNDVKTDDHDKVDDKKEELELAEPNELTEMKNIVKLLKAETLKLQTIIEGEAQTIIAHQEDGLLQLEIIKALAEKKDEKQSSNEEFLRIQLDKLQTLAQSQSQKVLGENERTGNTVAKEIVKGVTDIFEQFKDCLEDLIEKSGNRNRPQPKPLKYNVLLSNVFTGE